MKRTLKTLAVVLGGAGFVAFAAAPALCADDFCAMSGTLIKVEIVKEKAIEWGKDRKKTVVKGDGDAWSVLTLSRVDDDIAIVIGPDSVFFGVAGKGGREVDERDAQKAFGKDLDKLTKAVKEEMSDLWKADAVKMQGSDVQKLAKAAGLGTLEKGRDWELKTQDCKGLDIDASDLK